MGRWRSVPWPEVPREAWTQAVDTWDEAWLWHSLEYQEALGTWATRDNVSLAVVKGDSLLAILPLQCVELTRHRVLRYRQLHSQGGAALAPGLSRHERLEVEAALREALLDQLAESKASEIVISSTALAPARRDGDDGQVNPHLALGLTPCVGLTWVSDLRGGPDASWAAMEGRARTAVRKAERDGVTVRIGGEGDLDAYYDLHCATYARTGVPPHKRVYFERIWRDFIGRDTAQVFLAERAGEVIAAQTFAVHNQAAVYWTGASCDEALQLGANNLLQWTAMRSLPDAGVQWLEHGEAFPNANGKLKGLNDFKRSFGGVARPVPKGTLSQFSGLFRSVSSAIEVLRSGGRKLRAPRRSGG